MEMESRGNGNVNLKQSIDVRGHLRLALLTD